MGTVHLINYLPLVSGCMNENVCNVRIIPISPCTTAWNRSVMLQPYFPCHIFIWPRKATMDLRKWLHSYLVWELSDICPVSIFSIACLTRMFVRFTPLWTCYMEMCYCLECSTIKCKVYV